MGSLAQFASENIPSNDYEWAWKSYKNIILALQSKFNASSLLEVGAGRHPLITKNEFESAAIAYTANDIASAELALAPDWCSKAVFDICSPPTSVFGTYDLVFSKMVFEHIPDAETAYQAIYNLLAPGGICLTFCPTLYCLPFLINYLTPHTLSRRLQATFDKRPTPKFAAYYSWCRSSGSIIEGLKEIGFRDVHVRAFYGHNYYRSIPFVRGAERLWRKFARDHDIRTSSSFAYVFVQK